MNSLSKFERWFLTRIMRKMVQQGPNHYDNHVLFYRMLRGVHRAEFYEDNEVTADEFLRECFEATQSQNTFALLKR